MTSDQLRTVILEAVDCLRQRKCRPDRESIAVFVMRKLGSTMNEIFSEIENIVDQGMLLKVEYKGSTSYRSPKNFDVKNSPLLTKHSKILNSSKTTRYVISGMNELLSNFPNYSVEGIPHEELKKKLREFDNERFAESGIKVIFEREEGAGSIQIAESDDPAYPIRIFPKDIKVPDSMKLISFMDDASQAPERKRRKRPRKGGNEVEEPIVESSDVSTSSALGSAIDNANELVFAVKSEPKLIDEHTLKGNKAAMTKAEQISSICLKVVAGKMKSSRKVSKDKSNSKAGTTTGRNHSLKMEIDTVEQDHNNRKPCLALLSHEMNSGTTKVNSKTPKDTALTNDSVESAISTTQPTAPTAADKKTDTSKKRRNCGSRKEKRSHLESGMTPDDDGFDAFTISHNPPRYTYGSKKKRRSDILSPESEVFDRMRGESLKEETNTDRQQSNECPYCRKEKNFDGNDDLDFLICGTCGSKIHPRCIDYSEDQVKRLRLNSGSSESHLQWQCFSCKRCGSCLQALMSENSGSRISGAKVAIKGKGKKTKKKEQRYILCDQCDRGYHLECISGTPPSSDNSWFCDECESKNSKSRLGKRRKKEKLVTVKKQPVVKKKGRTILSQDDQKSETKDTVEGSTCPVKVESSNSVNSDKLDSSAVPDISSWTPSQVQKYFIEKGLNDEAASLREQEIDGMSLLLLRRADVIFGLNLRLGPALKIYRLVCQLQQHSSVLKKKLESEGRGNGKASEDATQ